MAANLSNNKNPKVTVLMPVYNGEKYLREAIESILNQTFKDFELLIIYDASTDSTKDIILSYKDSRIRFIENKGNVGFTKSLNKGLKLAKGKYIARMDADDISMLTRLEKQVGFLDKHKDIVVAGSWMEVINEELGKTYVVKNQCSPVMIRWTQIFKNQIAHSSAFFRKETIEELGCYKKRYKYIIDFDLWSRASRKYRIANMPEVLIKYRVYSKSLTKISRTREEQKRLTSEMLETILNNVNYYINLNKKDFKILNDVVKLAKISSFKNFIKARKIYKDLFSSYIKKENLNKKDLEKVSLNYKKKQRAMLSLYISSKFPKAYKLCRNLCKRNI